MWVKTQFFSLFYLLFISHQFFIFLIKEQKNLLSPISVSTLSFINDSLFISWEKSYKKSNTNLFCSYNIISSLFEKFSLVIKHNKSKVFYFSKLMKNYEIPFLDLSLLGGPLLHSKEN